MGKRVIFICGVLLSLSNFCHAEADYPKFPNSKDEAMKLRLLNEDQQAHFKSLLNAPGQDCRVIIGDWSGRADFVFEVTNSQLLKGQCVEGKVEGRASIKLSYQRSNTTESQILLSDTFENGQAVIVGNFHKGASDGRTQIYAEASSVIYVLTQLLENKHRYYSQLFGETHYQSGIIVGPSMFLHADSIDKGDYDDAVPMLELAQVYRHGLITDHTKTALPYAKQLILMPYKDGLLHGFDSENASSFNPGICYEHGNAVKKMASECGNE